MKREVVGNFYILIIVTDIGEYNRTIKGLKKDYPDKIIKLEEALLNYIGENHLEILKTGFPDKWKFLTRNLAYPYEFFNSSEDYQKHVDN